MNKDACINSTPSCMDSHQSGLLSVEDAEQRILALVKPLRSRERVDIRHALGRTIAEDVMSSIDVPAHSNSAMDGYAINADDIPASGIAQLTLAGIALAGKPYADSLSPGQCIRIMTGAKMPANSDTVIMQEQTEVSGNKVRIDANHQAGENVRQAGEDLSVGQRAIAAGKVITPADLGLLASMGFGEACVTRRLRVAFFSTGDELRPVGTPLGDSEIYDSNRYTLYGMLKRQGAELVDMGVIADNREDMIAAFTRAAHGADIVITSGGVSVGDADYVKDIVGELGEVDFWKLAIKPGRPLAFGKFGDALFFGLPGNPVAVMVTFYQLVQPAMRYMLGQKSIHPQRFQVNCTSTIRKRRGRTEYQRGQISYTENGKPEVSLTGAQGSGILSSMSAANCFIVLPADSATVEPGDPVWVEPFEGLA